MDEFTAKRKRKQAIEEMLDEIEHGESDPISEEVKKLLATDWRILLRNAILNAKKDVDLVVYTMEQVLYGKQLIRANGHIKVQIRFAYFESPLAGVPVGSIKIV